MSTNTAPSSSSDASASINNSTHSKARRSILSFLVAPFKTKRSINEPIPPRNSDNTASNTIETNPNQDINDCGEILVLSKLISNDLNYMTTAVDDVSQYDFGVVKDQIKESCEDLEEFVRSRNEMELHKLKKTVRKLKSQIPKRKIGSDDSNLPLDPWSESSDRSTSCSSSNQVDHINEDPKFEDGFEARFLGLAVELQRCLYYFLIFPENTILKKSLIIYWWIGARILPTSGQKTEEDFGNEYFITLIRQGFIEPINEKGGLVPDSCTIRPSVLNALSRLKENYSFEHVGYYLSKPNIGSATLYDDPKLLSSASSPQILYLGKWQRSATSHTPHIEVGAKFFDAQPFNIKKKSRLTFLSFRGISLITELPNLDPENLMDLKILDLSACYNLEALPNQIMRLTSLTHLDISGCYFLDSMPKSLLSLVNLQVLKGFHIGRSNKNQDLKIPQSLRKLSIYTSLKEFPTDNQLTALQNLHALQKLTISWGGCSLLGKTDLGKQAKAEASMALAAQQRPFAGRTLNSQIHRRNSPALPSKLEKLDLRGFPGMVKPNWLRSDNLKNLKKLYIRGGQLCDLGQFQRINEEDKWGVEILRLKYLSELEMDWRQVRKLFPNLINLDKVDCPKLTREENMDSD